MRLRLRLSLVARMAASVAILLSITLVIAALLAVVGAFLGLAVLGWLYRGAEAIAGLPRISAVAPVPALLVAGLAALAIGAAVGGWPHVRTRTDEEYLLPPTTPISAAVTAVVLGSLYLVVVEAGAALLAGLSTLAGVVGVVAFGILVAIGVTVGEVRSRVGAIREAVLAASVPVDEATPALDGVPGIDATTRRLAQLADVPVPELRVTETDRPESFTVGSGEEGVVVVSTGLVERLSTDELEAVLAHEVSHLANGDSRALGAALAPVLAADEWIEADPDRLGDYVWNWLFGALKTYAQFGVAVLARGREWCADAGAAELTGSPAALASALRKLSADREPPETDLRDWEQAVAVADVLPPVEPVVSTGPFRTHPPTEDRIAHLERLTRMAESGD